MNELTVILISVLGICVLLPAFIVWMVSRRKMYEARKRTELALAILKDNPSTDLEELIQKITPKADRKTRLLPLLWLGILFGILALTIAVLLSIVELASKQGFVFLCFILVVCIAISLPSLICYYIGTKK